MGVKHCKSMSHHTTAQHHSNDGFDYNDDVHGAEHRHKMQCPS